MSADALAPYREVAQLAERRLRLIESGHFGDELEALDARRDALTRGLPAVPPREAAPLLSQAMELDARAHRILAAALDSEGAETERMASVACSRFSSVLGQEIEISPPDTKVVGSAADAMQDLEHVEHMVSASFSVHGEPCRLVQLVPNAFTVRMTRALDELNAEYAGPPEPGATVGGEAGSLDYSLRHVGVRVWAELGRTRMAIGQAVGLSSGAVVELDRRWRSPSTCT